MSVPFDVEDAVAALDARGYVCLDPYLDAGELDRLRDDFAWLLRTDSALCHRRATDNGVQGYAHLRQLLAGDPGEACFKGLGRLRDDALLERLLSSYFQRLLPSWRAHERPLSTHEQLDFELNERPGKTNNSHFHYDRVPSVKCSLYLSDVGPDDGPLQVVPGSHFAARRSALSFLERNPDPLFVDNYVDFHAPCTPVELTGKAGSLVVFDTLVIHRGGQIRGTGSRRALRSVTWPPRLSRELFERRAQAGEPELRFSVHHPYDRSGQRTQDPRHLFSGA